MREADGELHGQDGEGKGAEPCYSITSLQSQPASSPSSSYLSPPFQREVNKQVVRHISVSVLRALPTTRAPVASESTVIMQHLAEPD
ncbi:hypothetical protein EYF80_002964 [Liparis tanakae]|uniref:Uncharacterized protein n=1 Tax=Liparis tanakae TaxID=230148 RepID=A0A4Z2JA25_9TELE|nr:hypothetical protein EYF80_002964 [Liparis tanakae]